MVGQRIIHIEQSKYHHLAWVEMCSVYHSSKEVKGMVGNV